MGKRGRVPPLGPLERASHADAAVLPVDGDSPREGGEAEHRESAACEHKVVREGLGALDFGEVRRFVELGALKPSLSGSSKVRPQ